MKATKTNRLDFLPAIGQAIIKGMCAESVAEAKRGRGVPHYCPADLFRLANIPMDFQKRWNAEKAIHDCLLKAREYGLVRKSCGHSGWYYNGPEIKQAAAERQKIRKAAKTKIVQHLKKLGLKAKVDDVQTDSYGPTPGRTTVKVELPKSLWIGP